MMSVRRQVASLLSSANFWAGHKEPRATYILQALVLSLHLHTLARRPYWDTE